MISLLRVEPPGVGHFDIFRASAVAVLEIDAYEIYFRGFDRGLESHDPLHRFAVRELPRDFLVVKILSTRAEADSADFHGLGRFLFLQSLLRGGWVHETPADLRHAQLESILIPKEEGE